VRETSRAHGADFLLLIGPLSANLDTGFDTSMRSPHQYESLYFGRKFKFGPDAGEGFVDAVPVVQSMAETMAVSEIFFDKIHPTAVANRKIARVLVAKLEPWLSARLKASTR